MRDTRAKALPFSDPRSMKRRIAFTASVLVLAVGAFYAGKSAVAQELPPAGAAIQAIAG
ncbi:hypothetical protein [Paracidovorax valerianellae]|uniref:Uncharacterized protein n=1 Tax=Paracidovorax valerianellae TaxID=187868 RepID=A0A1G6M8Z6_9BURK|nr:hypothetical protein [Paracidovorax valerianellae]MDA8444077.1 hypothetical protein [Paracidovorax valerianellae]SDC51973.1 hypothetical protein SAMN05192589_102353 [Paracidovorax valerianellae]